MILRTATNARQAAIMLHSDGFEAVRVVVATDDTRISQFCADHTIDCVMTTTDLATGSDRARAAADALDPDRTEFDYIINLQGDAPFTPPAHIRAVADGLLKEGADAATPYVQLSWDALDSLRTHKQDAPFSGTTLIEDSQGFAIWFSKTIIPALRKETALRAGNPLSPIKRHVGLYGYRRQTLVDFAALLESHYEQLEGLEQLRLLEAGYRLACVKVDPPRISLGGIDERADIAWAERLLAEHGDPYTGSDGITP
jgi:3-deoxy-manno-octulosonate cytidylyltransferase (CMP-KDO synthetase)